MSLNQECLPLSNNLKTRRGLPSGEACPADREIPRQDNAKSRMPVALSHRDITFKYAIRQIAKFLFI